MTPPSPGRRALPACLCALLAAFGCDGGASAPTTASEPGLPPAGVAQPDAVAADPGVDAEPTLKQIMVTLGKGPSALTPTLGQELKQDPPPWDAIKTQAREYARLASLIGPMEPPRGDKDSWAEKTRAFAESAAELDRAAQAQEQDDALTAHAALGNACMACHRQHRIMGPGMGGPGGFRGPGGPGGAPPGGGPPPR